MSKRLLEKETPDEAELRALVNATHPEQIGRETAEIARS